MRSKNGQDSLKTESHHSHQKEGDHQQIKEDLSSPVSLLAQQELSAPPGPPFIDESKLETSVSDSVDGSHQVKAQCLLFNDQTIRRGFIRKVYSILMCQLLVTVMIIALFVYHTPTRNYFNANRAYFFAALIFVVVLVIFMVCFETARRKAPGNYICLFIFTLAESFLMGTIASPYAPDTILVAAGLTVGICFALTIFAFQTKWDFTRISAGLFVCLILLIFFGICSIFFYSKILSLLYSTLGVLLFSMYLIHDTQLMMGGKHKYAISPEEYIFGALNLYIDVIRIFLHILSIKM